ncbi:MAG: hypothetical protein SGARI_008001 [Bacillariaceae sp.]
MKYDSDVASQIVKNDRSLIFAVGNDKKKRYAVSVMAIGAVKCLKPFGTIPMPRIVSYENDQKKTGFGFSWPQRLRTMLGERTVNVGIMLGCPTKAQLREMGQAISSKPLCDRDGKGVCAHEFNKSGFKAEDVATAGPPN